MVQEKHAERQDEMIVEIELSRLRDFKDHPFKVKADSQMIELIDSIGKYGILNPLIIRPRMDGCYEIISGYRRRFAAEQLGYKKVPVIIRVMQDDDAVISMVDSNLQRERICPSEKAFAYKMKYEVIKRRTGRRKCGQVDHHSGKKSIEIIGEETGDSPKQVQRYINITKLIPELLEKVDDGDVGFTPAVQLSFLKKKEQQELLEAMGFAQCTPSLSQAIRLKKMSAEGILTAEKMESTLSEIKQKDIDRVIFKNEQLYRFFPASYSADQMRREILEILKIWMNAYFEDLSTDAKVIYGFLLDRASLSKENEWIDKEGRVYINFTLKSVQDAMRCSEKSATKYLVELEQFGMIERIRQGQGKPVIIFVKHLSDPKKIRVQNRKSYQSRPEDFTGQGPKKLPANNTNNNNTDFNDTNLILSRDEDRMGYESYLFDQLGIPYLKQEYPFDTETVDAIMDLILDVLCSKREKMIIAGDEKSVNVVKGHFMKLNIEHIRYVIDQLKETTTKVYNIKQYMVLILRW